MTSLRMFPNGHDKTDEAKMARLEAHLYHLWRQLNELQTEISELKKDRAALLRRIGGWAVWLLVVGLSAILSKGSTMGYITQKFLETLSSAH